MANCQNNMRCSRTHITIFLKADLSPWHMYPGSNGVKFTNPVWGLRKVQFSENWINLFSGKEGAADEQTCKPQ